jgi:hypothetical protein
VETLLPETLTNLLTVVDLQTVSLPDMPQTAVVTQLTMLAASVIDKVSTLTMLPDIRRKFFLI